jgi:hypothetical protein
MTASNGRDHAVAVSDHVAMGLEVGADIAVSQRRVVVEREDPFFERS